jgi:hypothetical protein
MGFDLVVRDGIVVDGSGLGSYRADVGVVGGRIARVGRIRERGAQEVDAEGQVVTRGFVDGHTHTDAQVFWDRQGTNSCWHGVTTAVMGNCGFTLAPVRSDAHGLVVRNLERAEDMDAASLAAGIPWGWETFPQYLDAVDRLPKALNYAATSATRRCGPGRWASGRSTRRGSTAGADPGPPAAVASRRHGGGVVDPAEAPGRRHAAVRGAGHREGVARRDRAGGRPAERVRGPLPPRRPQPAHRRPPRAPRARIRARRLELLATARARPAHDIRSAVEAMVRPLTELAGRGWRERAYLKVGQDLMGQLDHASPEIRALMEATAGYEVAALLRERCPPLPDDVWQLRIDICIQFVGSAAAERARLVDRPRRRRGPDPMSDEMFVDNLIDMFLGALTVRLETAHPTA